MNRINKGLWRPLGREDNLTDDTQYPYAVGLQNIIPLPQKSKTIMEDLQRAWEMTLSGGKVGQLAMECG